MHLKMLSTKWQPFCSEEDELNSNMTLMCRRHMQFTFFNAFIYYTVLFLISFDHISIPTYPEHSTLSLILGPSGNKCTTTIKQIPHKCNIQWGWSINWYISYFEYCLHRCRYLQHQFLWLLDNFKKIQYLHWHWSWQLESIVPLNGRWVMEMMQGPEFVQSISTVKHERFKGRYKDSRGNCRYADLIIECVSWRRHEGIIKWDHFPRYWPFVRGIHLSPVNSPHKGHWRGSLMMFLLISAWVDNREAGDLIRHCAHYGVTVMGKCVV